MYYDRWLFLVLNVFNTFIAAYFFDGYLKNRRARPALYLCAVAFHYGSIAITYLLFDNAYLNMAVNLLSMLALSMCYAAPARSKLLSMAFLLAFGICAETLTLAVVAAIGAIRPGAVTGTALANVFGLVVSKILLFAIVKLMLLSQRRQSNRPIPLAYWIAVVAFPIGSICILVTMGGILLYGSAPSVSWTIFGVPCVLLTMNGMMFIVYDKLEESYRLDRQRALLVQQNEYYEQQYKQALYSDRRIMALRHDMKNQMLTLLAYADEGKLAQLHAYGTQLLGELSAVTNAANSGVPAVDALINYKAAFAMQQGIAWQARLSIPDDLVIDAIDIATLLGNMLDNAIDACMGLQSNRRIKTVLAYSQCALRICVENTYNGLSLRDGNHFASTKPDAKSHGFGLPAIRAVVDKYQGSLIVENGGDTFIVDAFLPNIMRKSDHSAC